MPLVCVPLHMHSVRVSVFSCSSQCGLRVQPTWCDICEGREIIYMTPPLILKDISILKAAALNLDSVCSGRSRGMHLSADVDLSVCWAESGDHSTRKSSEVGSPDLSQPNNRGALAWPPVPSSLPILSPCDNRDIPQPVPCLATGLSLNSSGVCGMLDGRVEQLEAKGREEMNNINKPRSVMAAGAWSTWMPTAGQMDTSARTVSLSLSHTYARTKTHTSAHTVWREETSAK